MSLTIKAYLLREGEQSEIRRFAVDEDVSTNHAYLRQKVTHIFPALKGKPFSLFWKDVENELIAFSSDEEQTEALGFVNDAVFKVYIKVEDDGDDGPEPEEENGVFHPHVFCDGCNGPVYGIRYKCTVCPDYDLCSKCKAKNLHSEHAMTAIPRPCCGWMGFGCFPQPPHHGHHGGPHHGHHGGPHHGHYGGPPHGPPNFPGAHPFGPHGRGSFGPWGRGRCFRAGPRLFHEMMKGVFQTAIQVDKEGKPAGGTQSEGKGTDTHCNEEGSAHEEYLKTVGEHVAAMLDPLGINVEVDVEHGGKRQRCCGQGAHNGWASWESEVHCETCSDSASSRNSPEEENPDGDAAKINRANDTCIESEEGAINMTSEQDTETGETGTASKADNQEGSPERDWTIIESGTKGADKPESDSCEVSDIDMKTSKDVQPPDTEKKINGALDHMKAMGFTDEGGWLTVLLKATNGDINKALDAIRANRAK